MRDDDDDDDADDDAAAAATLFEYESFQFGICTLFVSIVHTRLACSSYFCWWCAIDVAAQIIAVGDGGVGISLTS